MLYHCHLSASDLGALNDAEAPRYCQPSVYANSNTEAERRQGRIAEFAEERFLGIATVNSPIPANG